MLTNLLFCLLLFALAGLFAFLTLRAFRSGVTFIKENGFFWGGLITLVFGVGAVLIAIGLFKLYPPRSALVPQVSLSGTDEQHQRGAHIAASYCASCHSKESSLPLNGGEDLVKDLSAPIGNLVPVDLTQNSGILNGWSDGEIFRALRSGIDRQERWLPAMSNNGSRYLSDEDILAVIAYLHDQNGAAPDGTRSKTPLPDRLNLLAVFLLGAGMQPQEDTPQTGLVTAPSPAATRAYGEYIVRFENCRACHGPGLDGGLKGQIAPRGPSLRAVTIWTKEQFISTLRSGVTPRGNTMNSHMPWMSLGNLNDVELEALFTYISKVY
jgi:mono/diheme cytochrome c family protein